MKKILVAISLAFASASLHAAEYTVNLVTVGAGNQSMVFEPGYLKINKGDTVVLLPLTLPITPCLFRSPLKQNHSLLR